MNQGNITLEITILQLLLFHKSNEVKSNQMLVFGERRPENRSTGEKPLKAEYKNQQTRSDGECGN